LTGAIAAISSVPTVPIHLPVTICSSRLIIFATSVKEDEKESEECSLLFMEVIFVLPKVGRI
jgi:hypothetical protein